MLGASRPGLHRRLIGDVVIAGVSLVENYRAQFARVLRRSSCAELLDRLRAVAGTGTEQTVGAGPRYGPRVDILALAPLRHSHQTP